MRITKKDDDTAYLTFRITQIQFHSGIENGESVDYAEITIEHFGRSGTPFSTDDECIINITIAGDKGSCGPSGLQGSCGPSGIQGSCGLEGCGNPYPVTLVISSHYTPTSSSSVCCRSSLFDDPVTFVTERISSGCGTL